MSRQRLIKFRACHKLALLLSWPLFFTACVDNSSRPERLYTIYVDLKKQAVEKPKSPAKKKTSKVKQPIRPKQPDLGKKLKRRLSKLLTEIGNRGLIESDVQNGKQRIVRIEELIRVKDFGAAESLLASLNGDIKSIDIDEAFITKKNARLLDLIQTVKPNSKVLEQIDLESEAINQLLEQEDYVAINRRMNKLFKLLQK